MKTKILSLLLFIMASAFLASCEATKEVGGEDPNSPAALFKQATAPGAYVKGVNSLVFDEAIHQTAVSKDKRTYRIQDDTQTTFFHCELSAIPSEIGQKLTASVSTLGTNIAEGSYSVEVVKTSSGKHWLWSSDKATGFLVAF